MTVICLLRTNFVFGLCRVEYEQYAWTQWSAVPACTKTRKYGNWISRRKEIETNPHSCTRNIGVTSLHHSPVRMRWLILAPYSSGRENKSISEFLTGLAISNRNTAMFMEAMMLLQPKHKRFLLEFELPWQNNIHIGQWTSERQDQHITLSKDRKCHRSFVKLENPAYSHPSYALVRCELSFP